MPAPADTYTTTNINLKSSEEITEPWSGSERTRMPLRIADVDDAIVIVLVDTMTSPREPTESDQPQTTDGYADE